MTIKINKEGFKNNSTWDHSASLRDLYKKRCLKQVDEMTCHAQVAKLLIPSLKKGDVVLDAGCGSGYFYHSFKDRGVDINYMGVDASEALIQIGRDCIPALSDQNLFCERIENLDGEADHVTCINVLTYNEHYHRPLERLLKMAKKNLILRESIHQAPTQILYVEDKYVDKPLKVNVNNYCQDEMVDFIKSYGFDVEIVVDDFTKGEMQMVIDYPHYWKIIKACRK